MELGTSQIQACPAIAQHNDSSVVVHVCNAAQINEHIDPLQSVF